jgi:predicted DNA-binding transcriptional regulator AlpA
VAEKGFINSHGENRPMTALARSRDFLPAGLAPRGLSRTQAATYVGVSPSTFDRMVRDKLMPAPVRVYNRTIWDRQRLDAAFGALSGGLPAGDQWDRLAL